MTWAFHLPFSLGGSAHQLPTWNRLDLRQTRPDPRKNKKLRSALSARFLRLILLFSTPYTCGSLLLSLYFPGFDRTAVRSPPLHNKSSTLKDTKMKAVAVVSLGVALVAPVSAITLHQRDMPLVQKFDLTHHRNSIPPSSRRRRGETNTLSEGVVNNQVRRFRHE